MPVERCKTYKYRSKCEHYFSDSKMGVLVLHGTASDVKCDPINPANRATVVIFGFHLDSELFLYSFESVDNHIPIEQTAVKLIVSVDVRIGEKIIGRFLIWAVQKQRSLLHCVGFDLHFASFVTLKFSNKRPKKRL